MALKYKDIKKKLDSEPLSEEELGFIAELEEYIDAEILRKFDNDLIRIYLSNVNFESHFKDREFYPSTLKRSRRILLRDEIDKRYEEAGWIIGVEMDDGLDGPNRSGPDFWTLKGKE